MPRIKLTNPLTDPWVHAELPAGGLDKNGDPAMRDVDGNVQYIVFHKGDVVNVSDNTAEHLVNGGQAEYME